MCRVTKYSTFRRVFLQFVPGSFLYHHFEYREETGDEVVLCLSYSGQFEKNK